MDVVTTQRDHEFRVLACAGLAGIGCLQWALSGAATETAVVVVGSLAWPWCVRKVPGLRIRHLLEAALIGLLLGMAGLPVVAATALWAGLITANVARLGLGILLPAAGISGAGITAGMLVNPPSAWGGVLNLAAVVVLALISLVLARNGFELTRNLALVRASLAAEVADRRVLLKRMARYLPQSLCLRLEARADPSLAVCRHWLTVAFVDWVGFAALTERLAPEEIAEVISGYLGAISRLSDAHGVTVAKCLGDGVLLVAGDQSVERSKRPPDRASDAVGCVRVASELPAALRLCEQRWRARGVLADAQVRVGVASGFCTVGDWGERQLEYTVMGAPVNLASRLQGAAEPGQIWLAPASGQLMPEAVRCAEVMCPVAARVRGIGEVAAVCVPAASTARLAHLLASAKVPNGDAVHLP